ncbi:hypothetical protein P7C70_g7617, partial [Phenoliferia sp. Uapishka_3]
MRSSILFSLATALCASASAIHLSPRAGTAEEYLPPITIPDSATTYTAGTTNWVVWDPKVPASVNENNATQAVEVVLGWVTENPYSENLGGSTGAVLNTTNLYPPYSDGTVRITLPADLPYRTTYVVALIGHTTRSVSEQFTIVPANSTSSSAAATASVTARRLRVYSPLALSDLKRLSIQSSGYHRRTPHDIPPLDFSLEHLTLRTPGNPPSELIESLFAPECSSSIRSLSFIFLEPGNVPHWTPSIIPDLRNLTQLSLSLGYPIPLSVSTLLRFCTALRVLTLRDFLTPTSERLSTIGHSVPTPATITTVRLLGGESQLEARAPREEQYRELGMLMALPAMEKVSRVCAPAIDLQREWKQGMIFAQSDWTLNEGEQENVDWKAWLSLLID